MKLRTAKSLLALARQAANTKAAIERDGLALEARAWGADCGTIRDAIAILDAGITEALGRHDNGQDRTPKSEEQRALERQRAEQRRKENRAARVAALEPGQVTKCFVCRHRRPMHSKFNEHGIVRPACEPCAKTLWAAAERAMEEGR